jgi:hypothetical protein
MNNPNVITYGGPGLDDDDLGALSTSQLVPRLAGIHAQRGENQAVHFARLAGTVPRNKTTGAPLSISELEELVVGGVGALQRDRYAVAPTRIVKGVTTYTDDTDDMPLAIFGNPKFVTSMHAFANESEAEIEQEMIGKVRVDDSTREAAAARVLRRAKQREDSGAFQVGTIVEPVPGSDDDEHIQVNATIGFGRALAQVLLQGTVR